MKKYFFVFLLALAMISCVREEPCTCPPQQPCMVSKIIDLDIQPSQWSYTGVSDNNFFQATFEIPEITWDVYDNALIKVYREDNTKTEYAYQTELPFVRHYEYPYDVEVEGKTETYWGFYTETVDYSFTKGSLTIYYTASDFDYELNETFVPEAMHFRVVILYYIGK